VLRLDEDQQLRRRWPLALAAAALATMLALAAIGAVLYLRANRSGDAEQVAKPVVQSVPGAVPTPTAYVAIAPPPPVARPRLRHRFTSLHTGEPKRVVTPQPFRAPAEGEEFAPAERAYGPFPAVPLSREALRRVLVEDRRRTRELNKRELNNLQDP
jgi:hypothetical protein